MFRTFALSSTPSLRWHGPPVQTAPQTSSRKKPFVQLGMAAYGIACCSSATVSIGEKVRRFSEMDHLSC